MKESVEVVVLKDTQGNYYLLPRQGLEQARVPDEQRAEVEELLRGRAPGSRPLSEGELESVAGGRSLTSVGTFTVPSGLNVGSLQHNWSAGPLG
jgi:hypothetical protein